MKLKTITEVSLNFEILDNIDKKLITGGNNYREIFNFDLVGVFSGSEPFDAATFQYYNEAISGYETIVTSTSAQSRFTFSHVENSRAVYFDNTDNIYVIVQDQSNFLDYGMYGRYDELTTGYVYGGVLYGAAYTGQSTNNVNYVTNYSESTQYINGETIFTGYYTEFDTSSNTYRVIEFNDPNRLVRKNAYAGNIIYYDNETGRELIFGDSSNLQPIQQDPYNNFYSYVDLISDGYVYVDNGDYTFSEGSQGYSPIRQTAQFVDYDPSDGLGDNAGGYIVFTPPNGGQAINYQTIIGGVPQFEKIDVGIYRHISSGKVLYLENESEYLIGNLSTVPDNSSMTNYGSININKNVYSDTYFDEISGGYTTYERTEYSANLAPILSAYSDAVTLFGSLTSTELQTLANSFTSENPSYSGLPALNNTFSPNSSAYDIPYLEYMQRYYEGVGLRPKESGYVLKTSKDYVTQYNEWQAKYMTGQTTEQFKYKGYFEQSFPDAYKRMKLAEDNYTYTQNIKNTIQAVNTFLGIQADIFDDLLGQIRTDLVNSSSYGWTKHDLRITDHTPVIWAAAASYNSNLSALSQYFNQLQISVVKKK